MTSIASSSPGATVEQALALDRRLAARYRRLFFLICLPLFLLILVLAVTQYRHQRADFLKDMARDSAGHAIALESLAKSATDHVRQMRAWSSDYETVHPTRQNPLSKYLKPRMVDGKSQGVTLDAVPDVLRPGIGQILLPGAGAQDVPERGAMIDQALDFYSLARLRHDIDPHFQWSYIFSAQRDLVSIYPWVDSRTVVEGMGHRDLSAAVRSWFNYDVYLAGTPQKNPAGEPYWVGPYIDAGGTGAMISHAAPVYTAHGFMGVVGTDINVTTIAAFLQKMPRSVGRFLLLNDRGMVLADTAPLPKDKLSSAADVLPPGVQLADIEALAGKPGTPVNVGDYAVVARPIASAPWTLVHVVSKSDLQALLLPHFVPYAAIAIGLALTILASLYFLWREFVHPALRLVQYIQRLSNDEQTPEPPMPPLWRSWSSLVRNTFSAYRRSEAIRSSLVDQAPIAVIRVDAEAHIVEFNPAAEFMFGISRAQATRQKYHAILTPERFRIDQRDELRKFSRDEELLLSGRRIEMVAQHADGTEFPVEVALARAMLGDDIVFTAFVTDLSEKRRVEDDLARQRESLRQGEKMTAMGSLLAGVAHELNNPLAILIGRATLLESKVSDPKIKSDAGKIRDAAQRCGRIVKMFLSMARQRPAERRFIQVNDIIRSALDLLGYNLRTSGILIKTYLARDLPEIEADPDQIGQVITNLIVNAQQAMSGVQGQKRMVIGTTWNTVTRFVTLWVSDNGAGVPVELRERIFDPFFTTKAEGSGTGIGLSVSKSIVKSHQGELHLEPDEDGATFSVSLPIVGASQAGQQGEAGGTLPLLLGRGPHILIVDDEPEVAEMMAETLSDAGYDPVIAYEGQGALVWLAEQTPDLILSDVRMPGLDGPGLWREIEQHYPELRESVIFVTGDTLSPGVADFLQSTGRVSLEKPFSSEQLLGAVVNAIGRANPDAAKPAG